MASTTNKQFSPQSLRTLLSVLLAVIIVGGGAAFYWGLGIVREYATEVNHRLIDSEASGEEIRQLQSLQSTLGKNSDLINKANQVFATPSNYQTQVQSDLQAYAKAAGISITSTTFDTPTSGTSSVTITLGNPVSYDKLISFLNNIEGNTPKLAVSSLTIGPPDNGGANNVKTGDIKITIFVKEQ